MADLSTEFLRVHCSTSKNMRENSQFQPLLGLEDSRNGIIWIFDMPSGTCTSALSCHSQQARHAAACCGNGGVAVAAATSPTGAIHIQYRGFHHQEISRL